MGLSFQHVLKFMGFAFIGVNLLVTAPVYAVVEDANLAIHVAKIEGSGIAKIRRAKGTEVVAAIGDNLRTGDKISTDADVMVDLVLHDGSLVRVGFNTDYKVESIMEEKPGLWTWAFGMANGSIRALVEKSQEKGFVKFKVSTPSGTMGVRGTEIILTEQNDSLELITLHGEALLGPAKANFKDIKIYQSVGANMRSIIYKGQKRASTPVKFSLKELAQARAQQKIGAVAEQASADVRARAANPADRGKDMAEAKELAAKEALLGIKNKSSAINISDSDSEKILAKAQSEFNKAKESLDQQYKTENTLNSSAAATASASTTATASTNKASTTARTATKSSAGSSNSVAATTSATTTNSATAATTSTSGTSVKTSASKLAAAKTARAALTLEEVQKLQQEALYGVAKTEMSQQSEPQYVNNTKTTSSPTWGKESTGGDSDDGSYKNATSQISGAGLSSGVDTAGVCNSYQYVWHKSCSGALFWKKCSTTCTQTTQFIPVSCPAGTSAGSALVDSSSECKQPGARR